MRPLVGDALSVFLFLLGTGMSGVMGALAGPKGWRGRALWSSGGALIAGAILYWVWPAVSTIVPGAAATVAKAASTPMFVFFRNSFAVLTAFFGFLNAFRALRRNGTTESDATKDL
jgi:hypothetical protein